MIKEGSLVWLKNRSSFESPVYKVLSVDSFLDTVELALHGCRCGYYYLSDFELFSK